MLPSRAVQVTQATQESIQDYARDLVRTHSASNILLFKSVKEGALRKIACTVFEPNGVRLGLATCSPQDTYNEDIGKAIAMLRAFGCLVPETLISYSSLPTQANVMGAAATEPASVAGQPESIVDIAAALGLVANSTKAAPAAPQTLATYAGHSAGVDSELFDLRRENKRLKEKVERLSKALSALTE